MEGKEGRESGNMGIPFIFIFLDLAHEIPGSLTPETHSLRPPEKSNADAAI